MSAGSGSNIPLWYITFSDLMAILVGFFILLFGFSTMEAKRFRLAAASVRQAFGERAGPGAPVQTGTPIPPPGNAPDANAPTGVGPGKAAIYEKAVDVLGEYTHKPGVEVELDDLGVRFRITDALLFPANSSALQRDATPLLDRIATLAVRSGGNLIVEGHTDSELVHSDVFPSNWELAGARAGAVVRYFASTGIPGQRMVAESFADSRPRRPNATYEGRVKNRRVEILLRTEQ